jgi:hypothetical protein
VRKSCHYDHRNQRTDLIAPKTEDDIYTINMDVHICAMIINPDEPVVACVFYREMPNLVIVDVICVEAALRRQRLGGHVADAYFVHSFRPETQRHSSSSCAHFDAVSSLPKVPS